MKSVQMKGKQHIGVVGDSTGWWVGWWLDEIGIGKREAIGVGMGDSIGWWIQVTRWN